MDAADDVAATTVVRVRMAGRSEEAVGGVRNCLVTVATAPNSFLWVFVFVPISSRDRGGSDNGPRLVHHVESFGLRRMRVDGGGGDTARRFGAGKGNMIDAFGKRTPSS